MGIFFDNGIVWMLLIPVAIFLYIIFEAIIISHMKRQNKPNDVKYFTFMLMNLVNVIASFVGALCLGGIIDGIYNLVVNHTSILKVIGIILLIIFIKTVLFILFVYKKK